MGLSRDLEPLFSARVRGRGEEYFHQRRVQVLTGSPTTLVTRVRGENVYRSGIELGAGDTVRLHCTCPYYEDFGHCKHLWASVLAAEQYGYLTGISGSGRLLRLEEQQAAEPPVQPAPKPAAPPKPPAWQRQIQEIANPRAYHSPAKSAETWPPRRELIYALETTSFFEFDSSLMVELFTRDRKQNGDWGVPKELRLVDSQISSLRDPADREILTVLAGSRLNAYYGGIDREIGSRCGLLPLLAVDLVPRMARTGRCFLRTSHAGPMIPLEWDEGGPWRLVLEMQRHGSNRWVVAGVLERGNERSALTEPELHIAGGLVFRRGRISALEPDTPPEWIAYFRKGKRLEAADSERDELLRALLTTPHAPRISVPEELRYEEIRIAPRPMLRVSSDRETPRPGRLRAELWFEYEGHLVSATERNNGLFDAEKRCFMARDLKVEGEAADTLLEAGLKRPQPMFNDPDPDFEVLASKLPQVVRELMHAGWRIEADGKAFRRPGAFKMGVSSGIDWFELQGSVEYGEVSVKLPVLLKALRRGEYMVRLDDGTYGLLPEDWLKRFAPFAAMGDENQEHVRFGRNQAGLLDALLAGEPEAQFDEEFARIRDRLRSFEGVRAAPQPEGFHGELRGYQKEGLGWMCFLRDFGFGGCLADDMGVGKTAQVLALLETRRELRGSGEVGASLVVVPKSLVFNWKQEAARFTPNLNILDYTGTGRNGESFDDYDVVLTTYGTMRRDALRFRDFEFDYVVLDESQAIKNAASESAKAARLLRARHRLAMSGTPVENHLGELWSLFEFLNPGMLGAASVFKLMGGMRNPDEETRRLLAQAVRPFILRRTKQQVAPELPEKTEQTVYCELEPHQRKLYNELREHYRNSLLGRVERDGLAKSKIQVLEALLRLRQAACHPGLLDSGRINDSSAKIETLLAQVSEVVEEGHKALVFSQFTSLLRIVRDRLEAEGITYEYLDGTTQDRAGRVERFQNDPACPLFLISLKAGGLGLNLTAAEYVFLLDPWWNPAVEAQAVDRAHRIGQTKQVFAYRLIAKNTVEEKVLELQQTKRDLADAIIGEDNSLIRDLKREDLELLLS